MTLPKSKQGERFTYADYLAWDDDQHWELIDGEAFCMSQGPNRLHGVKEYWLIYPNDRTLLVYRLSEDGTYARPEVFWRRRTGTGFASG